MLLLEIGNYIDDEKYALRSAVLMADVVARVLSELPAVSLHANEGESGRLFCSVGVDEDAAHRYTTAFAASTQAGSAQALISAGRGHRDRFSGLVGTTIFLPCAMQRPRVRTPALPPGLRRLPP